MSLILAALATVFVVGAGYLVTCVVWPISSCRSPWGGSWRRCRKCKGTGERIRIGRRFWTWLTS